MKKLIYTLVFPFLIISCNDIQEQERGIPGPEEVKVKIPEINIDSVANNLKEKGYQTFTYEEGDTTYLMQQYYMVFLKRGENRSQDSTEAARLQKEHLAYLTRMAEEGYASLIGPFASDGDIRGIAVYNTATQEEADSLANQDPMVKAGRLKVEVHPWWTAKGGKLN
ncbi:YciI family protein [Salegentibacter sp. LM13S]|uniref:YciI family protein n=1 Tax=Salegentibacter lacus TaxID=2873599 RepID=UPI001CC9FA9B|nr:YciI family protein [Salegentibacter lacus]MBZ9629591.1 YciI family protein [Salegentibacter lacus]